MDLMDSMGFNGGLMGFNGILLEFEWWFNGTYPAWQVLT